MTATADRAYTVELPERGLRYLGASVRRQQTFARDEVESAIKRYFELAVHATETGDWNPWADQFTDDAIYVEHSFGIIRGRDEIRRWVTTVTGSTPMDLRMTIDWYLIDNDLCIFYCPNVLPAPDGGEPYRNSMVSVMCYAGNGQWCYEEDIANTHESARVTEAFKQAKIAAAG